MNFEFDKIFGAELAAALSLGLFNFCILFYFEAILLFLYVLGNSFKREEFLTVLREEIIWPVYFKISNSKSQKQKNFQRPENIGQHFKEKIGLLPEDRTNGFS